MNRALALPIVLLSLTSCVDRVVDGAESDLLPVCMLFPARGYSEEGQRGDATFLVGADGSTDRTCTCMTQEEFDDELRHDELHEQALLDCEELAAPYVSNSCQDEYEEGGWLISVLPATGDLTWLDDGKDLACSEQDELEGCSTAGDGSPPLLLVLVGLGLGLGRLTRARTPRAR